MIELSNNYPERVLSLTKALCQRLSIVGTAGEVELGEWLYEYIKSEVKTRKINDNLIIKKVISDSLNQASSIVLVYDPPQRVTDKTIIMCGHIDTVGVEEYGDLAQYAGDLDLIKQKLPPLVDKEIAEILQSDNTLVGRGTLDMKGSDAVMLELLFEWAASQQSSPLALILVCDEEDNSRGAKTAIPELHKILSELKLNPVLLLNGDYTSPRYLNDQHKYLYTGTIGKLLIAISVYGETCHVGQSTEGIGAGTILAAIATELDLNIHLTEVIDGIALPLPTWLHLGDTRKRYDVKIPEEAVGYLNYFYVKQTPTEIINKIKSRVEYAIEQLLIQRKSRFNNWLRLGGEGRYSEKTIKVCTVSDLVPSGQDSSEFWEEVLSRKNNWPSEPRQRHFELINEALKKISYTDPIVVIGFAPPFYPASYTSNHPIKELEPSLRVIEPNLRYQPIYPYISDMSWFATISSEFISQLKELGPAFNAYEIFDPPIQIPVINLGPIGFGAHQLTENVNKDYLVNVLPRLMCAIINNTLI